MKSVSHALSWALRHNAAMLGLRMTSDGYCPVQDILIHSHPRLVDITSLDNHIRPVVEGNDKQRFRLELRPRLLYESVNSNKNDALWSIIQLTEEQAAPVDAEVIEQFLAAEMMKEEPLAKATNNPGNVKSGIDRQYSKDGVTDSEESTQSSINKPAIDLIWCIRANQGHSLEGINAELLLNEIPAVEVASLPVIVHGTYFDAWEKIKSSGQLSRMNRNHIHCAAGPPDRHKHNGDKAHSEPTVISGMRTSCQIHIYINAAKCASQGVRFFRSDNGVLLTAGVDDKGFLPLEFVSHVMDHQGTVLLDQRDHSS